MRKKKVPVKAFPRKLACFSVYFSGVATKERVEKPHQSGVAQGAERSLGGKEYSCEAMFFFKIKLFDSKQ